MRQAVPTHRRAMSESPRRETASGDPLSIRKPTSEPTTKQAHIASIAPAAGAAGAPTGVGSEAVLRAARLGHRVSPAMVLGTAKGKDRVQRVTASISMTEDEVIAARVSGHRPPGNLRSGVGDHTTPYVTFEHMARNNVLGFTPKQAAKNLVVVLKRTKKLPGYASSGGSTRKTLDAYADEWIEFGESLKKPTKQQLQTLMEATVSLRNAVPMTAYKHSKSSGGLGESSSAGGLEWAEHMVRTGSWKKRSDFDGDPLQNVWSTFDFSAPILGSDASKWAAILQQHMQSIRESYPRLFEISGLYDMADMEAYLKKHVLKKEFGASFAKEIADEL